MVSPESRILGRIIARENEWPYCRGALRAPRRTSPVTGPPDQTRATSWVAEETTKQRSLLESGSAGTTKKPDRPD